MDNTGRNSRRSYRRSSRVFRAYVVRYGCIGRVMRNTKLSRITASLILGFVLAPKTMIVLLFLFLVAS